ncbi:hypothetical protein UlMin_029660 [Ulmus minor]
METKVNVSTLQNILTNLNFPRHVCVPPIGLAGGFCVAWQANLDMEPITLNKPIVSMLVFSTPGPPWLLSAIYGPWSYSAKRVFWDSLSSEADRFPGAWLLIGDYNGICSSSDRSSNHGVDRGNRVNSWLDRGMANEEWWGLFPNASIELLPQTSSDHNPQVLNCFGQQCSVKRPFRFEAAWIEDQRSFWVVNHAWGSRTHPNPPTRLLNKFQATQVALSRWNKNQFGNIQSNIKATREALAVTQLHLEDPGAHERDRNLRYHLNNLLKMEEIHWFQKSRLKWQLEGDRCTRFFFLTTLTRRKFNMIDCIKDDAGNWLSSQDQIGEAFMQRFLSVYDNPDLTEICLDNLITASLSNEENNALIRIPDGEEIRTTIFRLGSFKATGPDGLPVLFFKSYWDSVGEDVIAAVRDFFVTGNLHPSINSTNIVLVPKIKQPTSINHYRPIAVCNVIYKAISKLLANRLRPFLSSLIWPTQNAFVPGQFIHDNFVLIQEVIHAMKKRKGTKGWMGMKIDIQKAYDRLSWQFLEAVLKAFGFHPKWIQWIVTCCSTPKMTLLLNGAPVRSFFPKRGLRQGDPLSLYLFILCMEVLSHLINKKVADGLISGFKISRHSPALHHLFFADDVFLMGKCSINEAFYFKECLDDFCRWSGQSFNALKSNIFFNPAASRRTTGLITAMMGFSHIVPNSTYLGLPLFRSGHNKDFNFLGEQLDSKLAGWKARTLLKAKKLILIKSIALAVPTYSIQTVKLPSAICSKLDAHIRSFWWGPSSNGRKPLCLKAWDAMCKPKSLGGLGFRRMRDFNLALLSKWGWNILTGQNSLCLSVLRARYLLHSQFFEASSKAGDSKFWKSILSLKELIREGACYVVGDGCSIDPWKDPWVPNIPNFLPIPISEPSVSNTRVKDFFLQQGLWDIAKLALHYSPADVQAISAIRLPLRSKPDHWVWTPMSNGNFSTRSAYLLYNKFRFSDQNHLPKEIWLKIWGHKRLLPRHKLLWWHFLSNAFPTREKLNSIFHIENTSCPICSTNPEDALHLLFFFFFFCDLSRCCWLASPWSLRTESLPCPSPLEGLQFLWSLEASDVSSSRESEGDRNILLFCFGPFGSHLAAQKWYHTWGSYCESDDCLPKNLFVVLGAAGCPPFSSS